jgi:hypothetical protein
MLAPPIHCPFPDDGLDGFLAVPIMMPGEDGVDHRPPFRAAIPDGGCIEITRFREPDMTKQRYRFNSKPARDPDVSGASRQRQCLMCASRFVSTWAGERICRSCKNRSAWRSAARVTSRPGGMT